MTTGKGYGRLWATQFAANVRKNGILAVRRRRSSACEFLGPVIFLGLLAWIEWIVINARQPPDPRPGPLATFSSSQGPLPCFVFDSSEGKYGHGQVLPDAWCVPIAFAPAASANVTRIMTIMAERADYDLRLFGDGDVASAESPCTGPCILGFETQLQLIHWHMAHQGRLGVAVVFTGVEQHSCYAEEGRWICSEVSRRSLPPPPPPPPPPRPPRPSPCPRPPTPASYVLWAGVPVLQQEYSARVRAQRLPVGADERIHAAPARHLRTLVQ